MRSRSNSDLGRTRPVHRHAWLWEPLEADATFVLRTMFGAKAAYLDGRIVLCFCAGQEPWSGVLICTDQSRHAALIAEFPQLTPHAILPKWLYLTEADLRFETTAERLVALARRRDPRLGVTPQPRRRQPASNRRKKSRPS